jgi:hypothetical protein
MTDVAAEPLISNNREYPDDARHSNEAQDVEVDESALVSPGLFIWGLTICAGVSGLLFGYEYVCTSRDSLCDRRANTLYSMPLTNRSRVVPV